jgi:tape measure domain-containing protein
MAKLGDLVVRIGADTRDLNKSLGRVQRNMRSMTSNITRLGQDMTRSITIPLLGVGAAAIKSAADLEALETSFVSLTGGTEQAAMMMKQLNDFTAETPFQIEQVAKAARQLIASGTDVGEVNNQLQFLGDIAATSGNNIDELAAIFAKVNAKGKVELESLNQLAERGVPIFEALAQATGLPADKLGAGRVTVEQFNDVLKSFSEEGGFAAGAMERLSETTSGRFSTALDNAKQALAVLGEKLLPSVNAALVRLTKTFQAFGNLSDTTVDLALKIAGLVAVIGPLLVAVPKIIASIKLMNFAFLTTAPGILALSVALGAIAGLFVRVAKEAKTSTKETKRQEAALISLNKTQLALETGIKLTGETTEDIARINRSREESLRRVADATADLQRLEAAQAAGDAVTKAGLRDKIEALREYIATYSRSAEAAEQLLVVLDRESKALSETTDETNNLTNATGKAITTMGQFFSMLEETGIQAKTSIDKARMSMGEFFTMLEETPVATKLSEMQVKFNDFATAVQQSFEKAAEAVLVSVGTMIGAMAAGTSAPGDFANSILSIFANLATELGQLAIGYGVAIKGIKEALTTLNPVLAVVAGVALVALGAGLKGAIAKRTEAAGMPALKQGGLAYGPTTALVGDNRNARIDPEVIAPLSKLKDMMSSNAVEVFGRISGTDIYLSNTRTTTDRQRYA